MMGGYEVLIALGVCAIVMIIVFVSEAQKDRDNKNKKGEK